MQFSRPLSVVTPTLDGPVLTALASAGGPFTTGDLKRVLGEGSEEGIRRVLRRLVGQGVVTAERVGPAFSYRLNREHLAAEHIIELARLRDTFIARLQQLLESWAEPPVYAAVFGSAGRGSMRADSDIDLLLIRPDDDAGDWDQHMDGVVSTVAAWTGNDVRPLVYTISELGAARDEQVLGEVLKSGITVTGQRAWFQRQLRPGRR